MIIDSHCHIGFNKSKSLIVNEELIIKKQKEASVDFTIIFPLKSEDPYYKIFNKMVLKAANRHHSLIPFMRFNPKVVNNIKINKEFKGIKVHHTDSSVNLSEFREIVSLAENNDLIVLFHSTPLIMKTYEPVIAEFKNTPLIAAHATAYEPYAEMFSKYKNLYFDTSIKTSPLSLKRLALIDDSRILFGSDFPFSTPLIEKSKIELCPKNYLTNNQKKKILGLNAKKLLSL